MISKKILTSTRPTVEEALHEIATQLQSPKLLIYFTSKDKFLECTKCIHQLFPNCITIGSSCYRQFTKGSVTQDAIVVLSIDQDFECAAGVLHDIDTYPVKYVDTIQTAIHSLSSTSNTLCMELGIGLTNSEEKVLSTLNSVLDTYNIPLFGGTSADNGEFKLTYVGLNGQAYTNSCVFVLMRNKSGRVHIYKENIYQPTSHTFTATKVDLQNRIVYELNHKPAAEVLAKALGVSVQALPKHFDTHPMGRIVGKDIYISANKYITPEKGIAYYSRIYNNSKLVLLEPKDYKEELKNTLNCIKKDFPKYSFAIMINCVARTVLFENEHFLTSFVTQVGERGDYVGLACFGEQYNHYHFNQTMVFAVFE